MKRGGKEHYVLIIAILIAAFLVDVGSTKLVGKQIVDDSRGGASVSSTSTSPLGPAMRNPPPPQQCRFDENINNIVLTKLGYSPLNTRISSSPAEVGDPFHRTFDMNIRQPQQLLYDHVIYSAGPDQSIGTADDWHAVIEKNLGIDFSKVLQVSIPVNQQTPDKVYYALSDSTTFTQALKECDLPNCISTKNTLLQGMPWESEFIVDEIRGRVHILIEDLPNGNLKIISCDFINPNAPDSCGGNMNTFKEHVNQQITGSQKINVFAGKGFWYHTYRYPNLIWFFDVWTETHKRYGNVAAFNDVLFTTKYPILGSSNVLAFKGPGIVQGNAPIDLVAVDLDLGTVATVERVINKNNRNKNNRFIDGKGVVDFNERSFFTAYALSYPTTFGIKKQGEDAKEGNSAQAGGGRIFYISKNQAIYLMYLPNPTGGSNWKLVAINCP